MRPEKASIYEPNPIKRTARGLGHGVSSARHKLAGGLGEAKYLATMGIIKPTAWLLREPAVRWGERMLAATPVEFAPGFDEEFVGAIKEGCLPMLIINHTSDFDAIEAARLTKHLTDLANSNLPEDQQFESFLMITALSLKKGRSRPFEKLFYDAFGKFLKISHIEPIYTATINDKTVRGEDGNSKEYLGELEAKLQTRQFAIFFFPEGKVEGGRITERDGKRKGMQDFVPCRIADYIERVQENAHRPTVVIPASISGGWGVYDHRRRKLPLPTKKILLGFGRGERKPGDLEGVNVRVGLPVRSDQGWLAELLTKGTKTAMKEIDKRFGHIIAGELPAGQRGVHEDEFPIEQTIFPGQS
jgi:hypothetical protein